MEEAGCFVAGFLSGVGSNAGGGGAGGGVGGKGGGVAASPRQAKTFLVASVNEDGPTSGSNNGCRVVAIVSRG